jgi:hypothetical protein
MPIDVGDFRLMSRKALAAVKSMPEFSRYTRGMVSWVGFKQVAVDYERQERHSGESHYTLRKMIDLAVSAITGFSVHPLRLGLYAGMLMGLISCL